MKKSFLFLGLICLFFASDLLANSNNSVEKNDTAEAKTTETSKIDFSEPPFWIMSYDEIADMPWSQKDYYFKKLVPSLQKIKSLKNVNRNKLKNWVGDRSDWEKLMTSVYEECANKNSETLCKSLEDTRIDAIEIEGTKKHVKEN